MNKNKHLIKRERYNMLSIISYVFAVIFMIILSTGLVVTISMKGDITGDQVNALLSFFILSGLSLVINSGAKEMYVHHNNKYAREKA